MEYIKRTMKYGVECIFCHTTEDNIDINGCVFLDNEDENPINKINDYIESQLKANISPFQQQQILEKPSILSFLESDKERLKWDIIYYIKTNPTNQLTTYMNNLQIKEVLITQLLIIEYARSAYNNGFVQSFSENLDDCWNNLKGLILNMTEEQIKQEL